MGASHPIQPVLDKLGKTEGWVKGKHTQIIMCGPKNSGKSSVLYGLKIADVNQEEPDDGFEIEFLEYESVRINQNRNLFLI